MALLLVNIGSSAADVVDAVLIANPDELRRKTIVMVAIVPFARFAMPPDTPNSVTAKMPVDASALIRVAPDGSAFVQVTEGASLGPRLVMTVVIVMLLSAKCGPALAVKVNATSAGEFCACTAKAAVNTADKIRERMLGDIGTYLRVLNLLYTVIGARGHASQTADLW